MSIKDVEDIIVRSLNRVICRIAWYIVFGLCVVAVITWTSPHDDTDGHERSGLKLRTDYGTGCQYLETSNGDVHMGCL